MLKCDINMSIIKGKEANLSVFICRVSQGSSWLAFELNSIDEINIFFNMFFCVCVTTLTGISF